jgi:hypothetical protein
MIWNLVSGGPRAISEWRQKRKLLEMLRDPRSANGNRSIEQLEKGITADRATTERLLLALGARKLDASGLWTMAPLKSA